MKKVILTSILLVVSLVLHAQIFIDDPIDEDPFDTNSNYQERLEHIFGSIDKTKLTTGYLKDFGIHFANIELCNGVLTTDNHVNRFDWQRLYNSLYSMRVGSVALGMQSPNILNTHIKTEQQNSVVDVLLAVQYYKYQQYKSNAYTNGDVLINNDIITDVPGRNPYETKTLFAATALQDYLQGNTFTFVLPNNLYYTNNSTIINQIQIDFDNGQGYQSISKDVSKSVTYNTGGEKDIKIKITYQGGLVLESHTIIQVKYETSNAQTSRFDNTNILINNGFWRRKKVTGESWNDAAAKGRVTIELAEGHTQLTKPLIVIEGFDPNNSFNYNDFINEGEIGGVNIDLNPNPSVFYSLNQAIEDEEYDLVFIDFEDSTDYIQRNAYMVEKVIETVNQLKVSNEKNVVLGVSMGGLVGRYALRDMELKGKTHETKLYISHDSPHQGANVPLAVQAMTRHLVGEEVSLPAFISIFDVQLFDFSNNFPELQFALDLLESPAAKQMLIYQLKGTEISALDPNFIQVNTNSLHESFSTEYKNMGYPTQGGIRSIAISNGSECGASVGFNAYDPLVDLGVNVDLGFFTSNILFTIINALSLNPVKVVTSLLSSNHSLRAQLELRALPNQQDRRIYRARVYIQKKVLGFISVNDNLMDPFSFNSTSDMLPLDSSAGGIYDIQNFANLPTQVEDLLEQNSFSFIPTYSSLDVGSGNTTIDITDLGSVYSPLSPPLSPKNIPFDNFYTNPLSNENHTQFTLSNGNWLLDELKGTPSISSCDFACSQNVISGPGLVCNSANFSMPTASGTIDWSLSPSNAGTINIIDSNTITVNKGNYNGPVKLTAQISSTSCGAIQIDKNINLGTPTPNQGVLINGPSDLLTYQTGEFSLTNTNFNAASNYQWKVISYQYAGANIHFDILNQGNSTAFITPKDTAPSGSYVAQCRIMNSCGFQYVYEKLFTVTVGPPQIFFSVAPNPTNGEFNIIENDDRTNRQGMTPNSKIEGVIKNTQSNDMLGKKVTVMFHDMAGNLLKSKTFNRNKLTKRYKMLLNRIKNGIYHLRIVSGQVNEMYKIIVEK